MSIEKISVYNLECQVIVINGVNDHFWNSISKVHLAWNAHLGAIIIK